MTRLKSVMPRFPSLAIALVLAASTQAAHYTFTPLPETGNARVVVKLEKGEATEFRMPAWAPGDYEIFNYGKFIDTIQFKKNGQAADAQHSQTDMNLWTIPGGADEVIYTVK